MYWSLGATTQILHDTVCNNWYGAISKDSSDIAVQSAQATLAMNMSSNLLSKSQNVMCDNSSTPTTGNLGEKHGADLCICCCFFFFSKTRHSDNYHVSESLKKILCTDLAWREAALCSACRARSSAGDKLRPWRAVPITSLLFWGVWELESKVRITFIGLKLQNGIKKWEIPSCWDLKKNR